MYCIGGKKIDTGLLVLLGARMLEERDSGSEACVRVNRSSVRAVANYKG